MMEKRGVLDTFSGVCYRPARLEFARHWPSPRAVLLVVRDAPARLPQRGAPTRRNSTLIHTRTRTTTASRTPIGTIRIAGLFAAVIVVTFLASAPAQAQLTKDIRTSASPPVPPIQAFIKQQITKLHGNDPKATHDAREALLAESVAPGASPA